MVAPTVDDLDWIGDYMMDQFKAQHLDRVLKRIAGSRVAALLLTMRVQGWVEERGAPCLVTRSHVLGLLSASDPNFWIYERMSAVWAAGT